jgi:phage gp46-like protein
MEQVNKSIAVENWSDIRELVQMSIGTDKGSWWADPNFGSELFLLRQNGKVDGKTAGNFKRMLRECLAWIVADGIAREINCEAQRTGKNEITYTVETIQPNGGGEFIEEVWNGVQQG